MYMRRNTRLRNAAKEFAEKIMVIESAVELAIVGSVAGDDPCPCDLDLAMVMDRWSDIENLAKSARQMSPHHHSWEVFVFDMNCVYQGRLCHRKTCPAKSVDCLPGCGQVRHLRLEHDFEYDEKVFFSSPIEVLFSRNPKSLLLSYKDRLNVGTRSYSVVKGMRITCRDCGRNFLFTGNERKLFEKRGFSVPKHCPKCRVNRCI